MGEKTSLEKSHSKVSNFKLTLICFIASISFSAMWAGVAFETIDSYKIFGIILGICGGVFFVLSLLLISKFTR